ncbi:MAG: hypothetical protein K2X41_14375 [Hyphomicrobium sp.]|nr:hypothetical protein [Hyphomicrobium sp.]
MFKLMAVVVALTTIYSDYPAFLKRGGRVEAYNDLGPIVEFIVRCPVGTGIMSYSKLEHLYCSSKHTCHGSFQPAFKDTCG